MDTITIILIITAIIILYAIGIYNSLKRKGVKIDQGLSTIETYLEERFDMLTKMVASVNEESKREIELQTELTRARAGMGNGIEGLKEADEAMSRIQIQVEAYPTTQFNEGFRQLQRSILTIEDKLSAARRAYNAQVSAYNQQRITFPANLIANGMGFTEKTFFAVTDRKRQDVDMQDLFAK